MVSIPQTFEQAVAHVTDPRDALQSSILEDLDDHFSHHPSASFLYTLNTPTGTGKSALFIKMVDAFFCPPRISKRLPLFVSVNYKLLQEQHERLAKESIPSYLVRSITELNHRVLWPKKRTDIEKLKELYVAHGVEGFSPKLAKLVKQFVQPLASYENGASPDSVAQEMRGAIKRLLVLLSPKHTPETWRALLLSPAWYELLRLWSPLHLFAVEPAPLLMTGHSFSMPHHIVLPNKKHWHLNTFSDFARCAEQWRVLHKEPIEHCIVVMDEADALYFSALDTLSSSLGAFDVVRCLGQFKKLAMWDYIQSMGMEHWSWMAPRIPAILAWVRDVPLSSRTLSEEKAKEAMLLHAQTYYDDYQPVQFPNPHEFQTWWARFIELDYDRQRPHIYQKLYACSELWKHALAWNKANSKKPTAAAAFELCKRWMATVEACDNIVASEDDYNLYRSSTGGMFFTDHAALQTSLFDESMIVPDPRCKGQFILSFASTLHNQKSLQHKLSIPMAQYMQVVRAMHACVTSINWEIIHEPRDKNSSLDLLEYMRKFRGSFARVSNDSEQGSAAVESPLCEHYVYELKKSKTDLYRAPSAQHQPAHMTGININIVQTSKSPEFDLAQWLKEGHAVVLSSATVGLNGALYGTYNTDYIERSVRSMRPIRVQSLSAASQTHLDVLIAQNTDRYAITTTRLGDALGKEQYAGCEKTDQWMEHIDQMGLLNVSRNDSNIFTMATLQQDVRMLFQMMQSNKRRGLVMHLTNKDIQNFMNSLAQTIPHIVALYSMIENTYIINVHGLCKWALIDSAGFPESIRVVMYDKAWRQQFKKSTGHIQEEHLFCTTESPLLLFAANGSADRGINFAFTENDVLRDIDFFAVTTDPYFGDGMMKDKDGENDVRRSQEYIKMLAASTNPLSIMDSTLSYPSESHATLMPIVVEKNAKTVVQVLGRVYRYGTSGQADIYMVDTCANMLLDVYHRWCLDKRGSHVLRRAYQSLAEHPPARWALSMLTPTYDDYGDMLAAREQRIDMCIYACLQEMRSGSKKGLAYGIAWEGLRSSALYETALSSSFERIDDYLHALGLPSAFLRLPANSHVCIAQREGVSYLTDAGDPNVTKTTYYWQQRLAQQGIVSQLAKKWHHPRPSFPTHEGELYIEPWFIQRFMRAILGENLVTKYADQHMNAHNRTDPTSTWRRLKSLGSIGLSAQTQASLIETADLFYVNGARQQLLAIDAKYWGVSSDTRQAQCIVPNAKAKRQLLQNALTSTPGLASFTAHYALINVTGSRLHRANQHDGVYIGAATMPIDRAVHWTLHNQSPFPTSPLV